MKLTERVIQLCKVFAHEVTNTTYDLYRKRNVGLSKDKAINDHLKAKLSEFYVYEFLLNRNYACSPPCFKIKKSIDKNYEADLFIIDKNIEIHVKTCTKKLRSVLFEKKEIEHFKKKDNQFICIVEYLDEKNMQIISFQNANFYEYNKPIKKMPSKLAVYLWGFMQQLIERLEQIIKHLEILKESSFNVDKKSINHQLIAYKRILKETMEIKNYE